MSGILPPFGEGPEILPDIPDEPVTPDVNQYITAADVRHAYRRIAVPRRIDLPNALVNGDNGWEPAYVEMTIYDELQHMDENPRVPIVEDPPPEVLRWRQHNTARNEFALARVRTLNQRERFRDAVESLVPYYGPGRIREHIIRGVNAPSETVNHTVVHTWEPHGWT